MRVAILRPAAFFRTAVPRVADVRAIVFRVAVLRTVVWRPPALRAPDCRVMVFRAPVFRAAVFWAVVLRAAVLRPAVLRAPVLRPMVFRAAVLRAPVLRAAALRVAALRRVVRRAPVLRGRPGLRLLAINPSVMLVRDVRRWTSSTSKARIGLATARPRFQVLEFNEFAWAKVCMRAVWRDSVACRSAKFGSNAKLSQVPIKPLAYDFRPRNEMGRQYALPSRDPRVPSGCG